MSHIHPDNPASGTDRTGGKKAIKAGAGPVIEDCITRPEGSDREWVSTT
jgi:hypothetical protein